jgi:Lon protease-like protein
VESGPKRPVPVFPLPSLVLFPHVVLPLHIFEMRYRTMVRDALSGERLITLALLQPGWREDYAGSPEYHSLGCLARIHEVEWLPDDCYDLVVRGLHRVRIGRIAREFPYRAAEVELCPEHPYPEDDPLVRIERHALLDACSRLAISLGGETHTLDDSLAYAALVNAACTGAPMPPHEKLALLEQDSVIERGRLMREWIERRLQSRPQPPAEGGQHN